MTARLVPHRPLTLAAAAGWLLPLMMAAAAPASATVTTRPFLSELHYDNFGADAGEFVEVQLPAGTSTAGWSVVLYNGSGGTVYGTRPLPAVTAPTGAPAVVVLDYPSNGIQNGGPDGVALVDAAGGVVEFFSYEGAFSAVGGPAAGRASIDIGVAETADTQAGFSLSRAYDVATDSFVWRAPAESTKGAVNPAQPGGDGGPGEPVVPCAGAPTHEVGAVQGNGNVTPLAGQQVTVRATVVGDLPGLSGFFLQDPDGDGDPATSDGIFVFSPLAVDLGDTVQVTGMASERFGQTQLTAGDRTAVCVAGTAANLPAAAALDLPATDAVRESLEGMLVAPADTLTVSEVFALTRFGELLLSEGGLLVQPTELARPGPEAAAIAAQNALRRIVLDDGRSAGTSVTNRPYLTPTTPVRIGDELTLTAPVVLGYGFRPVAAAAGRRDGRGHFRAAGHPADRPRRGWRRCEDRCVQRAQLLPHPR